MRKPRQWGVNDRPRETQRTAGGSGTISCRPSPTFPRRPRPHPRDSSLKLGRKALRCKSDCVSRQAQLARGRNETALARRHGGTEQFNCKMLWKERYAYAVPKAVPCTSPCLRASVRELFRISGQRPAPAGRRNRRSSPRPTRRSAAPDSARSCRAGCSPRDRQTSPQASAGSRYGRTPAA